MKNLALLFFTIILFNFCSSKSIYNNLGTKYKNDTLIFTLNAKVNLSGNYFKSILNKKYNLPVKYIFRKGDYYINETLVIENDNVSFVFKKGARLINKSNQNGLILIKGNDYSLENLELIGNNISSKDMYGGFGVMLYGVNNAKIKNCKFKNISGVCIFLSRNNKGEGCEKALIENNNISFSAMNFSDYGDESGILLGYSGDNYFHKDNVIRNNIIDGNDRLKIGIGIIGHGDNNFIENNKISNCLAYGIVAYESDYTDKSLFRTRIIGNTIENIGEVENKKTKKGMGIYLMKSQNSFVLNNKIYNALRNSDQSETLGAGSISLNGAINTIVQGNEIDKSFMYGIVNAYAFNSSIEHNVIRNIRKSAIYLINVNDIEISENIIDSNNDVMIKGFFENTSTEYIKKMWKIEKYSNINTGNNIKVFNNTFIKPNEVLYFYTNMNKGIEYKENLISNNYIYNNIIYIDKNENVNSLIKFTSGKNNKIENNKFLKYISK